jgi:hypothetical protein
VENKTMRPLLLGAALLAAARFGVDGAATPVTVSAIGAVGKLFLSRTAFASGTSFMVDQSVASNAGLPLKLDLADAPAGWKCAYACPAGACDAMTYAVTRARTAPVETGAFTVTCTSSAFQTGDVPFGAAGDATTSGVLTFEQQTQAPFWVYGISLLSFGATATLSLYAATRV